jgi:hypothetical protein
MLIFIEYSLNNVSRSMRPLYALQVKIIFLGHRG